MVEVIITLPKTNYRASYNICGSLKRADKYPYQKHVFQSLFQHSTAAYRQVLCVLVLDVYMLIIIHTVNYYQTSLCEGLI